jgi:PKD repeat protein
LGQPGWLNAQAAGPVQIGVTIAGLGVQTASSPVYEPLGVLAAEPILGGTVSDGSGVQVVRVLVHDPLGNTFIETASLEDGNWVYTPDLSGWVVGVYTLRVQAVDVHGNTRIVGPYLLEVQDAPIVGLAAANDGPRLIGDELTFEATISHGSNVTYTWAFGDGATAKGQVVQHAYAASGDYTATVKAANSVSNAATTTTVTILALSVEAGEDQTADEGAMVDITATFTDGRAGVSHTATIDWGDEIVDDGVVVEAALTISGSHAYADNGTYTVTVTVGDGGHSAFDTLQVTVNNVAPTAVLTYDGPVDEAHEATVSFTEVYDPGINDTFTYSFDLDNDGDYEIKDQPEASAQCTWFDNGNYTVRGRVKDNDGGYSEITTVVKVGNAPPVVTASPESQIVQYSEAIAAITFTATDVAADTMTAALNWRLGEATFQDGAPAGLALGEGSCDTAGQVRTCAWQVTGYVGVPAGSYTIRLTVTDKDGGVTFKDVTLVVEPEEAVVDFDSSNPVAVQVAAPGGNSGDFTLGLCVQERDIPHAGDIGLAQLSLNLAPVGPGSSVAGIRREPVTANEQQCVTFDFSGVAVNTYVVEAIVGGGYYAGYNEDVLVVYDPSLGFTTGGGWFYWPGTADPESGYRGDKTNFGYTMKYNKKATNVQGSLLLIRHLADGTIYRVKSNALYGLALGEDSEAPMGWASFSGKSTYQEPGWPDPIGNYVFTVYVEDRNEPGTGVDRFWIEVSDGLALERPATDNALPIEGGNLVVPHRAK